MLTKGIGHWASVDLLFFIKNIMWDGLQICPEYVVYTIRSSHRGCPLERGVPKNFANFLGKHLCQSLFFKDALFTEHLHAAASAYYQ